MIELLISIAIVLFLTLFIASSGFAIAILYITITNWIKDKL